MYINILFAEKKSNAHVLWLEYRNTGCHVWTPHPLFKAALLNVLRSDLSPTMQFNSTELADEENLTFSSERARYFPQEFVKIKTEQKQSDY